MILLYPAHFVARNMVMVTAMPVIPAMAIAMQMIAVIPAARMPAMAIATVTQKLARIHGLVLRMLPMRMNISGCESGSFKVEDS